MKKKLTKAMALTANDVGIPLFPVHKPRVKVKKKTDSDKSITVFDLSSHARANEAMCFGLRMRDKGFHVFVLGEDRSGRMTATLSYLRQYIQNLPAPFDWVYLNNFTSPHRPRPFRLPNGMGCALKNGMMDLIASIHAILSKTFSHPHYMSQIEAMTGTLEEQVQRQLEEVQFFALSKGLSIEETPEGFSIQLAPSEQEDPAEKDRQYSPKDLQDIKEQLSRITTSAHMASRQLNQQIKETKQTIGAQILEPLFLRLRQDYDKYLKDWIDDLVTDVLEHVDDFLVEDLETKSRLSKIIEDRYSVNLFVDHKNADYPDVVLEPSPTYENLFGSIKYRAVPGGGMETDFTMIRPGALHRANGGILVLRAEALAQAPEVWEALKAALRDKRIRIEEHHRDNTMPLLDAPEPISIPMDVQVFLIGAPQWYYGVFFHDTDFKTYFKIKAEIDPVMDAIPENIKIYSGLIRQMSVLSSGQEIDDPATQYLIGYSSRWAENREKLSSKFEILNDILDEASTHAQIRKSEMIELQDIKQTIGERRKRNSRIEDRSHEDIESGQILIKTTGSVIGQVNGLSVLNAGDHQYGLPNRISARTYAGDLGVINIERLIDMSGPIQQKGVMILDGYLNGMFAQDFPLSCGCSLTFEQNYGGVEGDSASMAELMTILSSLADIPLRQDIAITGSINQMGEVQPVGGIVNKIEGFYRTCAHRKLTGTQGVIIPHTNLNNLVLKEEVTDAIKKGEFSIWAVSHIDQALEMLTGEPKRKIFSAIKKKLKMYHESLEKMK